MYCITALTDTCWWTSVLHVWRQWPLPRLKRCWNPKQFHVFENLKLSLCITLTQLSKDWPLARVDWTQQLCEWPPRHSSLPSLTLVSRPPLEKTWQWKTPDGHQRVVSTRHRFQVKEMPTCWNDVLIWHGPCFQQCRCVAYSGWFWQADVCDGRSKKKRSHVMHFFSSMGKCVFIGSSLTVIFGKHCLDIRVCLKFQKGLQKVFMYI